MEGSSLTMSVPNIITSNPGGGRFDFDDGGTYCGGWQDGKAHGHGVCTGPKNVGEYSGSWNFGFEMSGVYKWTNGAVYEGRWQNGKRHGVGVEYNGKWIYKGEWSQGFKGRYGVKASSNSAVKYEGTWANGLQDGYGSETYSDGGYYQGQMCRGLRHGYGVRKSAPYGDSQLNNPNKNGQFTGTGIQNSMLIHSNSLQSTGSVDINDDSPKPEDGFKPNIDRTLASKNGFVLVAKPLDVPISSKYNGDSSKASGRRNSLTNKLASARIPGSNQTVSILKGLRLRKQKSTSDLDAISGNHKSQDGRSSRAGAAHTPDDLQAIPFTLSPEELDITDPTTVETYTGEWKHDKRNGHGVCDRSDGLKYEGQWHNDMKCGYGVTTFKNGTKEEGKYKNNILIVDSKVKRFFQLGSSNIRQRIDEAVKMAHQAQTMALKKAEIADTRAATARDKADQATTAAVEADRDSQIAYSVARQYSDSQNPNNLGLQMSGMGANSMLNQAGNIHGGMQPMLPNLGMASNPLQLRRASQHQQQMNRYGAASMGSYGQTLDPNMMQDQRQAEMDQIYATGDQQQLQQHQQHQYLGPVEPFNGRRGSFRGGSQPLSGNSGYGGSRSNTVGFASNSPSMGPSFVQSTTRQSSDPFNDLFDHYKPTGASAANFSNMRSRRMPPKQTSLDQSQMRASVPRQMGASGSSTDYNDRLRRFRMSSSLDHAEDNHQKQQSILAQDSNLISNNLHQQQLERAGTPASELNIQNQLKHLVTSGEEMQRLQFDQSGQLTQQQQSQLAQQQQQQYEGNSISDQMRGATPTGSSYILPVSPNSSMMGNQTPSPEGQGSSFRSPSSQFYGGEVGGQQIGSMASYPTRVYPGMQYSHLMNQPRDVHSLADEQLYMNAGRRAQGFLDKTEFSNYDFTISSGPRMSKRCVRRTASLSRHSPSSRSVDLRSQSNTGSTLNALAGPSNSRNQLRGQSLAPQNRSFDHPAADEFAANRASSQIRQQPTFTIDESPNKRALEQSGTNSGSHLTLDSGSSSNLLNRKPSLQIRYDLVELGGLMSREEVAALSHAQRQQKRLESELAERRAKRPLLHLYLSVRELITRQRLLITVLVINVCFFKLFADLIT